MSTLDINDTPVNLPGRGPQGLSAYQVAVKNGYTGTEAEWLASLHAQPGEGGGLADAPIDGKVYARESGAWVQVPAAGIGEAPNDGHAYVREGAAWVQMPAIGSSTPPGATLRNVMTRGIPHRNEATDNKYGAGRSIHINHGGDLTDVVITYENIRADDQGQYLGGVGRQVRAAIEYPLNQNPPSLSPFKWGGNATLSFGDTERRRDSDSNTLLVPIPDGAEFGIRYWQYGPNGVLISDGNMSAYGECFNMSTDPLDDVTVGGLITDGGNQGDKGFYAIQLKAISNRPSVIIYHDSRGTGINDQPNTYGSIGGRGEIARSLDFGMAYTLCAVGADNAHQFLQHSAWRQELAEFHTHVLIGLGCGDLVDIGRTSAQILADLQAIWALFPTKRILQTTITTVATSSNNFADEDGQTPDGSEPQRQLLNTALRALNWDVSNVPVVRLIDIAKIMDSRTKPGAFKTPSTAPAGLYEEVMTFDGVHYSPYSYGLIQASGVCAPGRFN